MRWFGSGLIATGVGFGVTLSCVRHVVQHLGIVGFLVWVGRVGGPAHAALELVCRCGEIGFVIRALPCCMFPPAVVVAAHDAAEVGVFDSDCVSGIEDDPCEDGDSVFVGGRRPCPPAACLLVRWGSAVLGFSPLILGPVVVVVFSSMTRGGSV